MRFSITVRDDIHDLAIYWCAEKYKPASIERYLASIAHLHRAADLEDPTKSNRVKLALKTVKREKGTRQKQAKGMTLFDLARIEAVLEGTPRENRDYAMLRVARDAMLRSSNVVALNVEDFTFDEDGSGTVLIQRSKTDQEGRGSVKWISHDAVSAVQSWWRFAGIRSGAAFLTVTRGTSVKMNRVAKRDFERGIKRLSLKAGVDPLSGHSPRVGMSQDLTAAGIDLIAIMQAGGWKSTKMPARYTEHLAVKRGAVAQFYARPSCSTEEVE